MQISSQTGGSLSPGNISIVPGGCVLIVPTPGAVPAVVCFGNGVAGVGVGTTTSTPDPTSPPLTLLLILLLILPCLCCWWLLAFLLCGFCCCADWRPTLLLCCCVTARWKRSSRRWRWSCCDGRRFCAETTLCFCCRWDGAARVWDCCLCCGSNRSRARSGGERVLCGACTGEWQEDSGGWEWAFCRCSALAAVCCFCGNAHALDDIDDDADRSKPRPPPLLLPHAEDSVVPPSAAVLPSRDLSVTGPPGSGRRALRRGGVRNSRSTIATADVDAPPVAGVSRDAVILEEGGSDDEEDDKLPGFWLKDLADIINPTPRHVISKL